LRLSSHRCVAPNFQAARDYSIDKQWNDEQRTTAGRGIFLPTRLAGDVLGPTEQAIDVFER